MSKQVKKSGKKTKPSSESTTYRSKSRSTSRSTSRSSSRSRPTSKGSNTKRSKSRSASYSSNSFESSSHNSKSRSRSRSASSDSDRAPTYRLRNRSHSNEKPAKSGENKYKRSSSEHRKPRNELVRSGELESLNGAGRWRKSEPKYEPRYPTYGLNPMKLEGARRDTTNYYIHRRKIAEVKSRVDNRPPTIYPHVYCNMKKLKRQQEERALIERNNQFLLSKLYVAATTTRVDNKSQGRERERQRNQKRWEELRQTSSQHASRQQSSHLPGI
ncbi:hypothetical protein HELRODRAFT_190658 [Helobdella robusta]|uniref:Cilia- and flagella-associated protein 97 n=1 Tax=Helobdella robusta TaxID=6412 RepID=T1FS64_HELRO|nr:hypothetical protein HELRODRAFT_190658 [Helobdella robusta]ESO08911.1 hypothetical protein HELRODRAFT_190658 [Helobdella robusta]